METTSIQWSGGSIAALAFCLLGFLIWLSVVLGNRRSRKERAQAETEVPQHKHPMTAGRTYRLRFHSLAPLDGLKFEGRCGGDYDGPLQGMMLFRNVDGRRIAIKARLIQVIEET